MSGNSKIEWTEKTWNPVTGCTKVSQGCKHCYAEGVANRFFGKQYPANQDGSPRQFTDVRVHEERLDAPLKWRKPARIFVNSMSDLFHEDVPSEFIARVLGMAGDREGKRHTYQILTKRPERMKAIMETICAVGRCTPPPNLWLGVSVEDQATADKRIPLLLQTPAAVRWISYEPALAPVNVCNYLPLVTSNANGDEVEGVFFCAACGYTFNSEEHFCTRALNWVVCGGESGTDARPMHPEWARSMRDQCQAARVPFFFKQWGEWAAATLGAVGLTGFGVRTEQWMTESGTMPGRGHELHKFTDVVGAIRIGKHAAGRLLDGVPWNDYPERAA